MTLHQQTVDIFIRILPAVLMYGISRLAKGHGGHTVILRHDDIAFVAKVDEREVDSIGSCPNNLDFAVVGRQDMVVSQSSVTGTLYFLAIASICRTTGHASASTKIFIIFPFQTVDRYSPLAKMGRQIDPSKNSSGTG